jgi:arylsulfatase A-like enzyme
MIAGIAIFLILGVLVPKSVAAADSRGEAETAEGKPNIRYIFTDDQSHRTVSSYPEGYDWVQTPKIDLLAEQGVRFTHAYIGSFCFPSRVSTLTGNLQ